LQAVPVASELVIGKAVRVPFGVLDHNTPVTDATVHGQLFYVGPSGKQPKGSFDAPFDGDQLEGAGAYIAHLDLPQAGTWGADLTLQRPNGETARAEVPLSEAGQVLAAPIIPGIGQPAPRSHNLTLRDVAQVSLIDTGNPPDDMHQVSIADAIAAHQPALVVFASPGFCTSRICGPEVHVVQSLETAYRSRMAFIHVEIWTNYSPDPSKKTEAPTVLQWRLQTEPWVFVIDPNGIIRARFEGPTGADEIKAAIDSMLA
jgi:hypothetical protein